LCVFFNLFDRDTELRSNSPGVVPNEAPFERSGSNEDHGADTCRTLGQKTAAGGLDIFLPVDHRNCSYENDEPGKQCA
jgi:hypothetical protein